MKLCDACGKAETGTFMGGAYICRKCNLDIKEAVEKLRKAGKPVNINHIAKKMYRERAGELTAMNIRDVPAELNEKARQRAIVEHCTLREIAIKSLQSYLK